MAKRRTAHPRRQPRAMLAKQRVVQHARATRPVHTYTPKTACSPHDDQHTHRYIDGSGSGTIRFRGIVSKKAGLLPRRAKQADDPAWRQSTVRRIKRAYMKLSEDMDSTPRIKDVASALGRTDRQVKRWLKDCGTSLHRLGSTTDL